MAGMGTTGTLMGTGRYLKEKKPKCLIVGVEPTVGHTIQGLKNVGKVHRAQGSAPPQGLG